MAAGSGSLESLRELNRLRVVDALRRHGTLSRADIARVTGLSRSTISTLVADLQERGFIIERSDDARVRLTENAALFRSLMTEAGFELLPGEHPIVPVMFGDAALTAGIASQMQRRGVYVTAFSYPVVPVGRARIRVQLSAAHTPEQIHRCVDAFVAARDAA